MALTVAPNAKVEKRKPHKGSRAEGTGVAPAAKRSKAGQSHIRVSRRDLGGLWAHVGLEQKPPKIIRKLIFLVFERLNDSRNIAYLSLSHFVRDDASLLDKSVLH